VPLNAIASDAYSHPQNPLGMHARCWGKRNRWWSANAISWSVVASCVVKGKM